MSQWWEARHQDAEEMVSIWWMEKGFIFRCSFKKKTNTCICRPWAITWKSLTPYFSGGYSNVPSPQSSMYKILTLKLPRVYTDAYALNMFLKIRSDLGPINVQVLNVQFDELCSRFTHPYPMSHHPKKVENISITPVLSSLFLIEPPFHLQQPLSDSVPTCLRESHKWNSI